MKNKIIVLLVILSLFSGCASLRHHVKSLPASSAQAPRTLFIALDGVGYDTMRDLAPTYFKGFAPPVPMIASFPSITTPGFTGLFQPLGAKPAPGYELRFFSWQDNKIAGGTPGDFRRHPVDYKNFFDYTRHTTFSKTITYSFPGFAGKEDLDRISRLLRKSDKRLLISYIGTTDATSHVLGRERLVRFLRYMGEWLDRLVARHRQKYHEDLRIHLFSDHGFDFDTPKMVSHDGMKRALRAQGFAMEDRLKAPEDVVFVHYGLLSNGSAYSRTQRQKELARAISSVAGVDLSFTVEGSKIWIMGHDGSEAFAEYQGARFYRYETVTGDPLGLQRDYLPSELRQFHADDWWRYRTSDREYPDALYRLYQAFFSLVQNPATVLFSTLPGYQYGGTAALVGSFVRFGQKGTHGGLFRNASLAMVMTNDREIKLPPVLRYDEMMIFLAPEVVKKIGSATRSPQDILSLWQKEVVPRPLGVVRQTGVTGQEKSPH